MHKRYFGRTFSRDLLCDSGIAQQADISQPRVSDALPELLFSTLNQKGQNREVLPPLYRVGYLFYKDPSGHTGTGIVHRIILLMLLLLLPCRGFTAPPVVQDAVSQMQQFIGGLEGLTSDRIHPSALFFS